MCRRASRELLLLSIAIRISNSWSALVYIAERENGSKETLKKQKGVFIGCSESFHAPLRVVVFMPRRPSNLI